MGKYDQFRNPKRRKGAVANDNWKPERPHEVMKQNLIDAGYWDLIERSLAENPNLDEETAVSELHARY
jgi:hypothetical protein